MTNLNEAVERAGRAAHWAATGTRPEEWLQFGALLLAGALILWLLRRKALPRVVTLLESRSIPGAQHAARALEAPAFILVTLFFLNRAKSVFENMPGWLWQMIEDIVPAFYGLAVLVLAFRLIDLAGAMLRARWSSPDSNLDEQMAGLAVHGLKGVVLAVGAIVVLEQLGVKVLGIVAGLSFVGAAFALAAQNTLANVIGGIEILADRLFKVGDRIAFDTYDGFVVRSGLRSVELAALTGERINLPNKDLVDKQIRNYTRGRFTRTILTIGLTYGTSAARVKEAMALIGEIMAEAKTGPGALPIDRHETAFKRLADFALEIEVLFWAAYRTHEELNAILTRLNLAIKERFDAAGLEFAFPTQTVHVEGAGAGGAPEVRA